MVDPIDPGEVPIGTVTYAEGSCLAGSITGGFAANGAGAIYGDSLCGAIAAGYVANGAGAIYGDSIAGALAGAKIAYIVAGAYAIFGNSIGGCALGSLSVATDQYVSNTPSIRYRRAGMSAQGGSASGLSMAGYDIGQGSGGGSAAGVATFG